MTKNDTARQLIDSQFRTWIDNQKDKDIVDGLITAQFREGKKAPQKKKNIEYRPFVTISREYGCGGYEVAKELADIINEEYNVDPVWVPYDRELVDSIMNDLGLSENLAKTLTTTARKALDEIAQTTFGNLPPQVAVYRSLAETVRTLATNGHVILVGRGGNLITRILNTGYHVRLIADHEWKLKRITKFFNTTRRDAEKRMREKTKEREEYLRAFLKYDVADPSNYDLVINQARHSVQETARMILHGLVVKDLFKYKKK